MTDGINQVFTCFDDIENDSPFIFTLNDLQLLQAGFAAEEETDCLNLYRSTLLIIHLQLRQLERDVWLSFATNDTFVTSATYKAKALLEELTSAEDQMAVWPDTLPPESGYAIIQLPRDEILDLWSTDGYAYSTLAAGNNWLRYRTLQTLLHSLRLRAYRLLASPKYNHSHGHSHEQFGCELGNPLLSNLAHGVASTHSKIRVMVDDICASMPFHLGYMTNSGPERRYPTESFPQGKYPHRLAACHMVWPLYVAGIVEGVDAAQRLWISRQLAVLDRELGVGKVAVLAELVREAAVGKKQNGA